MRFGMINNQQSLERYVKVNVFPPITEFINKIKIIQQCINEFNIKSSKINTQKEMNDIQNKIDIRVIIFLNKKAPWMNNEQNKIIITKNINICNIFYRCNSLHVMT